MKFVTAPSCAAGPRFLAQATIQAFNNKSKENQP